MVNFEDGTLVKGAYVVINGVEYPVVMPEYSGNTPVSSENLNKVQNDLQQETITKVDGTILFENAEGVSEDFYLNDNISNYKYVEVFFKENMSETFSSAKCQVVSNTKLALSVSRIGSTYIYQFATSITFIDMVASFGSINLHVYFNPTTGQVVQNNESLDKKILVQKVIGYM